ncbi:hypothetical protein MP228_002735 [Amoeboaphelidium protococcarum]|nr:hypothetical protein MP228_002735 [Amoeboaphelidium protococcarum]
MLLLCALSGRIPAEPVVVTSSGLVYERRVIEQYLDENGGKDPHRGQIITKADLLPLAGFFQLKDQDKEQNNKKSAKAIKSKLQQVESLEHKALIILDRENQRLKQELATALYRLDASKRVIAQQMTSNSNNKSS